MIKRICMDCNKLIPLKAEDYNTNEDFTSHGLCRNCFEKRSSIKRIMNKIRDLCEAKDVARHIMLNIPTDSKRYQELKVASNQLDEELKAEKEELYKLIKSKLSI